MRRTVFLAVASLVFVMGVSAQQRNIDTQKSRLTIHVGKSGVFSGLGHEHEVSAQIHSGTADTGSHPAVEIRVNARELRVIDKDASDKDRAEVQRTMLGRMCSIASINRRSCSSPHVRRVPARGNGRFGEI